MHLLAQFSLKNRALIALVTVVVALFGTISMSLLKLELIPSVTFPQLVVVSSYPGASPVIVEKEVSTPIESAIQGVPGLESTKATSYSGVSQISVSFRYGTNLDTAQQKVEIAINNISSLLPSSVNPQVIAGSFADIPIMQLAVTSDLSPDQLNQALSDIAVSELTKIDGVRAASISGANGEHVSIVPKTDVMNAKDLTTTDIQTALQTAGIRLGAGTVDSKNGELSIISGETLSSVSDIKKLPVTLPIKTSVTTPKTTTPTIPEMPDIPLIRVPQGSGPGINSMVGSA